MKNKIYFQMAAFAAGMLMMGAISTSCTVDDSYQVYDNPSNPVIVQEVNLSVDYSAFKTYGPVFFRVYTEDPFITDDDTYEKKWNENVKPVYEDYTEDNGKFHAVVELPSYARHLYIATDNFFTGILLMETDVKDGAASVVAENSNVLSCRQ